MNIILLSNRDIASNLALNHLWPELQHHQITLFLSDQVGQQHSKPMPLQQLQFVEQSLFNDLLSPLLETKQLTKPSESPPLKTFAQLADSCDLSIEPSVQINSQAGLARIKALNPDLMVCIRYGAILQQKVIAVPKLGVINLHSSLLPDYRGVMATFWAMLHGEKEYGLSLHFIDDQHIDMGPIISQHRMTLNHQQSYLWNVLQLYRPGAEMVIRAINALNQGHPLPVAEQSKEGSYFSFPGDAELEQFIAQGYALFNGKELMDYYQQFQQH